MIEGEFDLDVYVMELFAEPDLIIKKVENSKIFCAKCHSPFKINFSKKLIVAKCECMIMLLYPKKDKSGSHLLNFFISEAYLGAVKTATDEVSGERARRKFISDTLPSTYTWIKKQRGKHGG